MCGAGWAGGTLEPAGVGSFQPSLPKVLTLTQFHTHTHSHEVPAKGFDRTVAGKERDAQYAGFYFPNTVHICMFRF